MDGASNLGPAILDLVAADGVGNGSHDIFLDRKSTRLNSSHQIISYAVLCLKKKNADDRRLTLRNSCHLSISDVYFVVYKRRVRHSK